MKKVLTVVGARPQFVKAAVLSRSLSVRSDMREVLVHTGQHYDPSLSEAFFQELDMRSPDYNLGIAGGGHGDMTGRMMTALEPIVVTERPDLVIVYGDTNSTLAAVLVASKLYIPVAHVEAGLRSFDRRMPEEINRVATDHLSDLHFCPTKASVANLAAEGVTVGVHHVGDVMYDAAIYAAARIAGRPSPLKRLGLSEQRFVVLTLHRAENTDNGDQLVRLLTYVLSEAADTTIVFPIHPRTRQAVHRTGLSLDSFLTLDPLPYFDMAELIASAALVLTDSGGLQKEAYFYRVPCITLRDSTEWSETIEAGWNRLYTSPEWRTPRKDICDYGEGDSGAHIVEILAAYSP